MEIGALHRKGTREKQICVFIFILSPTTHTLSCLLFLIDISVSLGLVSFLIKSNKRWYRLDGVDMLDIKEDLKRGQTWL